MESGLVQQGNCLIIDDDENICDLLKNSLERNGYRVGVAQSSEDGIQILREMYPDLLLLDINLPGRDGLSMLQHLRSDPLFKNLPIAMISGKADRKTVLRAIQLGASTFVTKPIKESIIIPKLAELMSLYHKALENNTDKKNTIQIKRILNASVFEFIGQINSSTIIEFKKIFTRAFKIQTKNNIIVFDLRFQQFLSEDQIHSIQIMQGTFQENEVRFLAGRNYTALLLMGADPETQLFISNKDLELSLNAKSHNY